jgi:hypothetical protein
MSCIGDWQNGVKDALCAQWRCERRYQVLGEGPRDLVVVFGWVSNVEVMWEEPMLARFLNRLASCARVIV